MLMAATKRSKHDDGDDTVDDEECGSCSGFSNL